MRIVIIQTAFIGDVILCTPVIEDLNSAGHKTSFVLKPEAADLLKSDPGIEKLYIYDKRAKDKGVSGILRISRQLREDKYDVAVIPHRSLRSALIAYLAKIPKRIGFDKSAGKFLLTDVIKYDKNAHEIVRNHSLIRPLGITGEPPAPRLKVSDEDREIVTRQFKEWNISESNVVIGMGPGSKWFTKQWGIERFRKLTEILIEKTSAKIIVFGGPEENSLGQQLSNVEPERVFNRAGQFSLSQSSAALEKTRVVVSNDNGLTHLAAASGARVIAIFGPTIPGFGFAPRGDNHAVLERELYCRPCSRHGTKSCPERHFRCMTEITSEDVFEKLLTYIHHE